LLNYPLWHLTNLHNSSHPLQSNLSVQSLIKMRVDISIMALEVPLKIYHLQPPSMTTTTTTSRIRLNKSRHHISQQWTTTTRHQFSSHSSLNNQHRLSTKKSSTRYRQVSRYRHPQSIRHPSTHLQQLAEVMHMTSHTTQF
jgi:hypothetical protein